MRVVRPQVSITGARRAKDLTETVYGSRTLFYADVVAGVWGAQTREKQRQGQAVTLRG